MPVTDSIQSLRSSAFAYRKARVVIRDNVAHVFVNASGPPSHTFTIIPTPATATSSMTYSTVEYGTISYRPVGSSCTWALAKCRVTKEQLLARVPASTPTEPTPQHVDPSYVPDDIELRSVTPEPVTTPIDPATLSDDTLEPITAEIEELTEEQLEALTAPDEQDFDPDDPDHRFGATQS